MSSLGIARDLIYVIFHHLHEITPRVLLKGKNSSEHFIKASVPYGSVHGPLLWSVHINDLLHLIVQTTANAEEFTVCLYKKNLVGWIIFEAKNISLRIMKKWSSKMENFLPLLKHKQRK